MTRSILTSILLCPPMYGKAEIFEVGELEKWRGWSRRGSFFSRSHLWLDPRDLKQRHTYYMNYWLPKTHGIINGEGKQACFCADCGSSVQRPHLTRKPLAAACDRREWLFTGANSIKETQGERWTLEGLGESEPRGTRNF
jgi:hypothetical protein